MGGIPIDRSSPQGLVSQSIELYRNSDKMILAIPPEGTRSKVDHWKSGFYHIAVGAQAPIATGFIDYKRKATGFGPVIHPTGDIEADMKLIRNFYSNVTGKYPDQMGEIMIAPRSRKMRM
jgi:1-acyl-sn-glycerol-3-phosphate acyltransferase